jgi:enamine deaminase RidA (YjgF/YER057c/UK114 family)
LVPSDVSLELARDCAAQCALNGLAALEQEIGDLARVRRVVRLGGFVACGHGFGDQPTVINGASDLLAELMHDSGKHARAAVGVSSLPLNAPVEIEFTFLVD